MVAGAVPGEDGLLVGEGEGDRAEQRAQPSRRLAGRVPGESGAQGRGGERGGVQGVERGLFDGGAGAGRVLLLAAQGHMPERGPEDEQREAGHGEQEHTEDTHRSRPPTPRG